MTTLYFVIRRIAFWYRYGSKSTPGHSVLKGYPIIEADDSEATRRSGNYSSTTPATSYTKLCPLSVGLNNHLRLRWYLASQFLNRWQHSKKKIKQINSSYSQEPARHMTGLQFFPVTCITFCAGAMYLWKSSTSRGHLESTVLVTVLKSSSIT